MDETFGTTMHDSSGKGNDGTMNNVVTSGGGFVFDGSSSYVIVPNSPTLNPGTSNFSYTVQVQTNVMPASGKDYDLMRKGLSTTSGGEFKVEIEYSGGIGRALCVIKDGGGKSGSVTGTTNVVDGALHTITCTKKSDRVVLKIDSLDARKKYVTLGKISNTAPLLIGARTSTVRDSTNDWYAGTIRSAGLSVG
ncbi:LamG-like jellyroll fold domain-containing protein [Sphingomonas sp.]|uniref:LamG-like jellyroll fold domain-containing protein n=1 Tax=Sphingomonas sp. TaxID=28214 RepID=UPI0025E225B8|nr:LamG-like jellyroll fold domain-containing protein [Sphingomonas sp.]MBV9526823.1 hypothetical protein [Sphingomonas sp.]